MKNRLALMVIVYLVVGLQIWHFYPLMPSIAASHFGANGLANGFMPKAVFCITYIVLITVIQAIFLFIIPWTLSKSPNAIINLPNKNYWLAPERRASTIRYLSFQMLLFGLLTVFFLVTVFQLVFIANLQNKPMMPVSQIMIVLIPFLIVTIGWSFELVTKFKRIPAGK